MDARGFLVSDARFANREGCASYVVVVNAVGVSENPRVEIGVVDRHVLPGAPRRVSGPSSQGPRVDQAGAHLVGLAQALLVAQLVVEDVGGGGAGEEGEEEVLALLVVLQPDAGVVLPAVAVDVGRRAQAADAELVEGLQRVDGEPLPTRLLCWYLWDLWKNAQLTGR